MLNPDNVKDNAYIYFGKKAMLNILNLKLVIMLEYRNTKIVFFIYLNLYLPLVYKSSRS